jgi:uncharacterized protein (TIGR00369 family)
MDPTAVAAQLLEPVPANRLFGIEVRSATPDGAEVVLEVRAEATNVIGSLHAGGLAALVDATGLAAILGQAPDGAVLDDLGILGAAASLRFLAPARGRLTGRCTLDEQAHRAVCDVLVRGADRATVDTEVRIDDEAGTCVCTGRFEWRLRRAPSG